MAAMKLEALGLDPGDAVAFVGAGGKTTAIWRTLAELVAAGGRAICTTTTKVMEPVLPRDGALMLAAHPNAARVADLLEREPRLTLAARRLSESFSLHAGHPVPSRPFKLEGLRPDVLDGLFAELPDVTWLVEADGAKGCGLKIPAAHEPVIPSRVTVVIVMAHLDTLGQPLGETTVHRVADAARILGVPIGTPLTPAMFVRVLCDEALGLKGVPQGARVAALLTQRGATLHPAGWALADQLLQSQRRYSRVIIAALRSDDPVLAMVGR
jgi:probable selenium-dependent hydroxylase accessory protein YqeC